MTLNAELLSTLCDFEPDTACVDPYCWGGGHVTLSDEERAALPPFAVFLAFVTFAKYPFAGRSEKIAWAIPIRFRGLPFVLEHQKFGFHIYPLSKPPSELVRELIGRVRHAVQCVDKLMQPFAEIQVRKGNVTIVNRQSTFRFMYEFLRDKANEAYAAPA